MVDVRLLAGKLNHLSPGQIEPLLLELAEDGDDQAVSRLLQVCAVNEIKLEPTISVLLCWGVRGATRFRPMFRTAGRERRPTAAGSNRGK